MKQLRIVNIAFSICLALLTCFSSTCQAQQNVSEDDIALQKSEVARLAMMDGHWRGEAWIMLPTGKRQSLTQTERVGPLLDGSVRVVEGRGYDENDQTAFNALAVIAYDLQKKSLIMRSYAQGRSGDFVVTPSADGYTWEIPAGPATIRYSATIKDDEWFETGERVMPNQKPMRFFEMRLKRLGDTDWPGANPVPSK